MVVEDMGMFAESASIKAGSVEREDRSVPWDLPGEWQSRRIRHLELALELVVGELERVLSR